ncbi:MAG: response regulator [Leptolyngbyaceae cyanobacterium]
MAKILLIDPDTTSRQILEHAFTLYEYEVVTTQRGDEGLTLAVSEAPDLIILDVDVAGFNGWQVIKRLKEASPTWLIPVIAMAAPAVDGQLLVQTGFDAYIRKPASAKHVLQRIETLLDQTARVSGDELTSPSPVGQHTTADSLDAQHQPDYATVVHIDDSPDDSQAMAKIVEGAGYRYVNISDSLQALSQLIDLKPQLIFLELVLPITNGYELCAQIRRIPLFKWTPIIIVTTSKKVSNRVRAKMVGASDFVSKPIKAQPILKALIKYLSSYSKV